jgi:hypothetical protein
MSQKHTKETDLSLLDLLLHFPLRLLPLLADVASGVTANGLGNGFG